MALATGDSLGKLIRRRFAGGARTAIGVLIAALLISNCLNLAADLMAIGQGAHMLHAGAAWIWSLIAGVGLTLLMLFGSFEWIGRIFKWLCLALFAYVVVLFIVHVNWADMLKGLVGLQWQWSPQYLGLAVAILGTTISPYMFFWQTAQRIEEERAEPLDGDHAPPLSDRTPRQARRKLISGRVDVFTGMVFSVLIMFAIIAATAATVGAHHQQISSAADAAKALQPIAGPYAGALFAVGFIGSGILAVPVLAASGASGMAALLDRPWGLEDKPNRAPLFYILLGVGIIAGTAFAVFVGNPIQILVLSAIVNGIAAGPFLIVMMIIARNRAIMGHYRNRALSQSLGWATTVIMIAAGIYGVWFTIWGPHH
jgi:Mn2+/Fe2+ NRAMP family transporter